MTCSAGVLGKCTSLQITSFGNYHQRLTWDTPSTLNITAVEPDIFSHIVCSNISTECTIINVTETGGDSSGLRQHVFPNLRAYINFTVTAVNIVGIGESASIVTEPCECPEGSVEKFADQTLLAMASFDTENTPSLSVAVIVSILLQNHLLFYKSYIYFVEFLLYSIVLSSCTSQLASPCPSLKIFSSYVVKLYALLIRVAT